MKPVPHDVFLAQCKRRFGVSNPERIHSEHWEWMVRSKEGSWHARKLCGGDPHAPFNQNPWKPEWCFDRFGVSRTRMPDGRIICIGGEHEDWYDPDFCIFNDVVVLFPADGKDDVDLESGRVEIYGYPESIFPPTDFHSATLVGEKIFIVGSLGYRDDRDDDTCQVHVLDSRSYRIEPAEHSGPHPGWISHHHASYDPAAHAITVRGGKQIVADDYRANNRVHRLHLEDMRWEQVADHEPHFRYVFRCRGSWDFGMVDGYQPALPFAELDLGSKPLADRRIDIGGVPIEFDDFGGELRVFIEGDLGEDMRLHFLQDLLSYLESKIASDWYFSEVESFD